MHTIKNRKYTSDSESSSESDDDKNRNSEEEEEENTDEDERFQHCLTAQDFASVINSLPEDEKTDTLRRKMVDIAQSFPETFHIEKNKGRHKKKTSKKETKKDADTKKKKDRKTHPSYEGRGWDTERLNRRDTHSRHD